LGTGDTHMTRKQAQATTAEAQAQAMDGLAAFVRKVNAIPESHGFLKDATGALTTKRKAGMSITLLVGAVAKAYGVSATDADALLTALETRGFERKYRSYYLPKAERQAQAAHAPTRTASALDAILAKVKKS